MQELPEGYEHYTSEDEAGSRIQKLRPKKVGKSKDKKAKSKQRKKSKSPTNKQDQGRTGTTKSPKNKSSNLSKYLNNSSANFTQ